MCQMQHDQQGQEHFPMQVHGPVQDGGHDGRVAKAAYGELFGGALNDGDKDSLKECHCPPVHDAVG